MAAHHRELAECAIRDRGLRKWLLVNRLHPRPGDAALDEITGGRRRMWPETADSGRAQPAGEEDRSVRAKVVPSWRAETIA